MIPPADSPPQSGWLTELALQATALVLTGLILLTGLRLDRADFHSPFSYEADALLILPFVKEVIETGSHWRTERMGAPGTQELHDFPVVDHLHLGVIWLLSRAFPDPVVCFNLFYVLTYPLTTAAALFALRRLGISAPMAVVAAILYSFQPYHYLRGQIHYFLAAYYVIPLTLSVALDLCRGRSAPVRGGFWRGLVAVLVALATASAGAYYAFFSCFFLALAGVYGAFAGRSWRPLAAGGILTALVVGGGVVNHWPAFRYQAANGQNPRPRERQAEEAELYGLKFAQLVLPVPGHNMVVVDDRILFDPAAIRAMYQAPTSKEINETDWDALGLIGSLGYVGLLAAACLPGARRWPFGPLAALTVAGTLLGTIGGFGAVFNLLVSPQVRCYNRVSIFLAFLALAAAALVADLIGRALLRRSPSSAALAWPFAALVILFGTWDQTNDAWFPDNRVPRPGYKTVEALRREAARRYAVDAEFYGRIEAILGRGMVFTYPFIEFPEAKPFSEPGAAGRTECYEMALGYLHTEHLRWSFGAMKGREWDAWQRKVSGREPVPRFLERLALAGFEGLLVDTRGLNPRHAKEFLRELDQYLGRGALAETHPDRKRLFFDLRPYRDALKRSFSPAAFEALSRAEKTGLVTLWMKGFLSFEPTGLEDRQHWGQESAELVLFNRSDEPVEVTLRMKFKTTFKGEALLKVDSTLRTPGGGAWADEVAIAADPRPPEYKRVVVVPPGRHAVRFHCEPDGPVLPTDSRRLMFQVRDYRAE